MPVSDGIAPGRRPRARVDEIRRAELIDAAIRTIDAVGFDRTTVRDIAAAADTATGSVHYYFKTKADLLRVAFVETERRFHARVTEATGDLRGVDKLLRLIDLSFPENPELVPAWNVEIDLWQQAARQPDFRTLFEDANRPWVALIQGALREAVTDAQAPATLDTERCALELAALLDGLTLYCRVTDRVDSRVAATLLKARVADLALPTSGDVGSRRSRARDRAGEQRAKTAQRAVQKRSASADGADRSSRQR